MYFFSMNLHENGIQFPGERKVLVSDRQIGIGDVTCKPVVTNEMYFFQVAFVFLTNASVTITRKATETGAVVRAMGIDAVGIEIT